MKNHIRSLRQRFMNRNPLCNFRTPYDFRTEMRTRSWASGYRFIIRFVSEEMMLGLGVFKSWFNEQIIRSHNVDIGKNFQIGPQKCDFFIPKGGHIHIRDNVKFYTPIELVTNTQNFSDVKIVIGDRTTVGANVSIRAAKLITIGAYCMIARGVTIIDTNAHPLDPDKRIRRERIPDDEIRAVEIGNNVWIGEGAVICPGVTIGSGSIIGANSVVIKDVPENVVVLGNPARVASWLKNIKLTKNNQKRINEKIK